MRPLKCHHSMCSLSCSPTTMSNKIELLSVCLEIPQTVEYWFSNIFPFRFLISVKQEEVLQNDWVITFDSSFLAFFFNLHLNCKSLLMSSWNRQHLLSRQRRLSHSNCPGRWALVISPLLLQISADDIFLISRWDMFYPCLCLDWLYPTPKRWWTNVSTSVWLKCSWHTTKTPDL